MSSLRRDWATRWYPLESVIPSPRSAAVNDAGLPFERFSGVALGAEPLAAFQRAPDVPLKIGRPRSVAQRDPADGSRGTQHASLAARRHRRGREHQLDLGRLERVGEELLDDDRIEASLNRLREKLDQESRENRTEGLPRDGGRQDAVG